MTVTLLIQLSLSIAIFGVSIGLISLLFNADRITKVGFTIAFMGLIVALLVLVWSVV